MNKTKENQEVKLAEENESVEKDTKEKEIKSLGLMDRILNESKNPPQIGSLIEGKVLALDKKGVFVDIPPYGTGIIFGREYMNAREIIKRIQIGDTIAAKVVDNSNPEGYMELSLKEARQALIWSEAEEAVKDSRTFELVIKEANKGGLIMEWQGIQGFLPASQLKADHYPRVPDGDKDKIYEELKKLVNEKLTVTMIGVVQKEGKLIFSEKDTDVKNKEKVIEKYHVGDVVEGVITGVVDFGAFIKVEDDLEGLIHISEIDWGLVEDPRKFCKVGDKIKVKVIEVKDGKVSLSIKALKENPWVEATKKYKKDDLVKGVTIKYNKHGALASIEEGVAGLVHISEFGGSDEKLKQSLELGKSYDFKITLFDSKEQKMALSLVTK